MWRKSFKIKIEAREILINDLFNIISLFIYIFFKLWGLPIKLNILYIEFVYPLYILLNNQIKIHI